jgi:hypothetical protein
MVSPVVQDTVKVGVLSFVMLSVVELPESDADARSGVPGALADVSTVTERPEEANDVFPAGSVD